MGFFSSFLKWSKKKRKTSEDQNDPAHGESNPIATPPLLSLNILSIHVRLYSAPPAEISNDALAQQAMTPGNKAPPTPVTRLLSGTLADFLQYSGKEASCWLINIDTIECRGTLFIQRGQGWFRVMDTDPLIASQYRYRLHPGVIIRLSKISRRIGNSRTSTTGNANTMANHVMQHDGKCWVTRASEPLINSHIWSKRMGDHMARIIFQTFTPHIPPADLSIYHENFGLNLVQQLNHLFELYKLGFHYVAPVRTFCLLISKFFTDQTFRTVISAMFLFIQVTIKITP